MKPNRSFCTLAIAAASLLTAGTSAAATPELDWQWGINPSPILTEYLWVGGGQGESFARVNTFTLTDTFNLLAHGVTNDAGPLDIGQAMATLWDTNADEDYTNDVLLGGFDFDTTVVQQSFAGLTAGDYYFLIEGQVDGSEGGGLLFSWTLAPVPEPGTYGLMAAGLAVVGWLGRRSASTSA